MNLTRLIPTGFSTVVNHKLQFFSSFTHHFSDKAKAPNSLCKISWNQLISTTATFFAERTSF